MAELNKSMIDPRSGFCKANSIFYSKRKPIPLPANQSLDLTTFISSQAHHGTTAFIDASTGRRLTFSQLWQAVDSVASCLSQIGIRKGHVILILSPNSLFFPIVCLSVMSLGALITTANPLNTPQELARQLADCKPKLAFTTLQFAPKLAESNLPIVLLEDDNMNKQSHFNVVTTITEMIKKEPSPSRVRERVNQDDTASLLYSSGTTGLSKGVITSHRNLITLVQTFISREQNSVEKREKRFLCTVPMFHIYGLGAFALSIPATGTTVVILPKFDMWEMFASIQKYGVTDLSLVPPIFVSMVNGADQIKAKYDLSSLQSVICGGSTMGKEVIQGFLAEYPTVKILQGYAMTETAGVGAMTESLEESKRYGTVGLLTPSLEAKIVDPNSGKALSVNCKGELWLKGPSITKGYLSNPEATYSTIDSEGWLRTGDLCYIDDDGFIFVVDRLKELIKYKAYQVPPAELEALLLTHSEISDAAVIPFPDKEVGQYPMAYVVNKAGSNLSETAVMDFVARQVAPYKKIRKVAFVSKIPKTPSGKILRRDLIKLATSKL